jgi:N utilization substance protein A
MKLHLIYARASNGTIGKEGQNVRLAARLTGWKIDIKDIALYKGEQEVKTDETDPESQDLDRE